jgi:aspartate aminotransferase
MKLAQRLNTIAEPQTIKMAKMSRELKAQGLDVVDLSLGEPDFATPGHITTAAVAAIDEGYTKYPPVAGFPELRKAICEKFKRDNQLEYTPEQVMVSTGAKQSLANVILCLVDNGDEVVIPTPYWVTYSDLVRLAGGTPVFVPGGIENDFKITPEQLEAAITPATRLFIFSSPCNPTGSVYNKEELAGLAAVFARHPQVTIVSDEIYEYINFIGRHESIAQFEGMQERTVIINGMSKGYAMTGWRLGYIAGPKELITACEKLQSQFTSGANSITQRATITALLSDNAPSMEMQQAYLERRDFVLEALRQIPGLKVNNPQGAFYVFPDISAYFGLSDGETTINNAQDLCIYLLHKGLVTTVQGDAFGDGNCLRLSYATSMENLQKAVDRMKESLGRLQPVAQLQ